MSQHQQHSVGKSVIGGVTGIMRFARVLLSERVVISCVCIFTTNS